jgi:hypothetical protein
MRHGAGRLRVARCESRRYAEEQALLRSAQPRTSRRAFSLCSSTEPAGLSIALASSTDLNCITSRATGLAALPLRSEKRQDAGKTQALLRSAQPRTSRRAFSLCSSTEPAGLSIALASSTDLNCLTSRATGLAALSAAKREKRQDAKTTQALLRSAQPWTSRCAFSLGSSTDHAFQTCCCCFARPTPSESARGRWPRQVRSAASVVSLARRKRS